MTKKVQSHYNEKYKIGVFEQSAKRAANYPPNCLLLKMVLLSQTIPTVHKTNCVSEYSTVVLIHDRGSERLGGSQKFS